MRHEQTSRRHSGLIAINLALVAILAVITLLPTDAEAQQRRARGDYTMVAGEVQGLTEAAIYIVDSNNSEMVALRWDNSRRSLAPIGFRDLAADSRAARGGRTR